MRKRNERAALKNLNHMKSNLTTPYSFDFHIVDHVCFFSTIVSKLST